ncbi:HNH endonuclease [Actinokineospora pegani]|uniref:HNH endonuclease n=1 Tax=Actinokineospora pegani TaxID=2654637 RepID=UPI0012EA4E11|nr:HNH endonuclease [Actinokineospora pegani]
MTTGEQLLHWLGHLRPHTKPDGVRSLHKPLSVIWALGRVAEGERLHSWSRFDVEVGGLLDAFGGDGSRRTPEYPFGRLRGDQWELVGWADAAQPGRGELNRLNPSGGFTEATFAALLDDALRARAIDVVRRAYLSELDQEGVLAAVGLEGWGSASGAPRRTVTRAEVERSRRNAAWVKRHHEDTCQLCGTRLALVGRHYSEAAHIRGLGAPHDGPDVPENMLCLCPNCHKRFDAFALCIDPAGRVLQVSEGSTAVVGALTTRDGHEVDQACVAYHRERCLA